MALVLQQLINGLTLGAVYGLIAIGYTMVYGIIGMINFAHGDIYMVSAFIAVTGFTLLSAFGVGGTLGSIQAARLSIRLGNFRAALVLMLFMALTQALASAAVGSWVLMIGSSFLLGLGSGMVVPLQTRLMDVAGEAQSMAAAMNHAAFNAANALGPWLAGMALGAGWGWRSSGIVGVGLSFAGIAALALAWWQAARNGQLDSGHAMQNRSARS